MPATTDRIALVDRSGAILLSEEIDGSFLLHVQQHTYIYPDSLPLETNIGIPRITSGQVYESANPYGGGGGASSNRNKNEFKLQKKQEQSNKKVKLRQKKQIEQEDQIPQPTIILTLSIASIKPNTSKINKPTISYGYNDDEAIIDLILRLL